MLNNEKLRCRNTNMNAKEHKFSIFRLRNNKEKIKKI